MTDTGTDSTGIKLVPPIALLIVLVVCVATEVWLPVPRFAAPWPAFLYLGIAIALLGFFISASGLWRFFRQKVHPSPTHSVPRLVNGGIYRFTRNPMYLGIELALIGVALTFGSYVFLAGALAMFLYFTFYVIPREEAYLGRKFGRDYAEFCARVRRWV